MNKALNKARHFHKVNLFSPELQELFDESKDLWEKAIIEERKQFAEVITIITKKQLAQLEGDPQ